MASPSGTSSDPSTSGSTSDESLRIFEPLSTKLAFQSDKRYHVFLSFRGPDVRNTFVDHLFRALSDAGLNVFLDTEKLKKGEIIDETLEGAIESSAIRIPIFSKGYAQSTWCLREAAAMLRTPGLIIPLFYHVDPTHVRYPEKENTPYKEAFDKHRRNSNQFETGEIERWVDALLEICKRSGWSMDIADGFESRMIKRVVIDVIKTLDIVPLQVAKHPVGLEGIKNVLIQKLVLNSEDKVVKIGIWGIGGIGKTTAAKAVYNQIYLDFDAASFVPNFRATAKEPADLTKLQEAILRKLSDFNGNVESVDSGVSLLENFLSGKRVLLVLDDVNSKEQLNALVGDSLALGSRVILTSRDRHILNIAGVSSECIHEMSRLEINEGLELFSWHAFLGKSPSASHKDLSKSRVEACKGHPLSLEVIGSYLYDKHEVQGCWEEALHDITQNSEIYNRFYISYRALNDDEKEIFVDIACFFIGEASKLPIVFWKSMYK